MIPDELRRWVPMTHVRTAVVRPHAHRRTARHCPARLLIVDSHPQVCEALHWALDEEPDLHVVGAVQTGSAAQHQAALLHPDLVLLDAILCQRTDGTVLRALTTLPTPPAVLVLVVQGEDAWPTDPCLGQGAGIVAKSAGWVAVISAIRTTLHRRGDAYPISSYR